MRAWLLPVGVAAVVGVACGGLEAAPVPGGNPDEAPVLFQAYGCVACHAIPGVPGVDGGVGPPLGDFGERRVIAGNLPNTPGNLVFWIRFPQEVEPGTVMPDLGVSEDDARDMAAYLLED